MHSCRLDEYRLYGGARDAGRGPALMAGASPPAEARDTGACPGLSIPVVGIPFFERLDRDVALHLAEVKACKSGIVELRYEVRGHRWAARNAT